MVASYVKLWWLEGDIVFLGSSHSLTSSDDSLLAATLWPWLMGTCSLVPGQIVEEETLFPSIKLLV